MSKFATNRVRFSYAQQLYQPKNNDKGEPKFGVTLLIPKSDKDGVSRFLDVSEAVRRAKFPGKDDAFYKVWPRTLHDGDGVKATTGEPYGKECKGHWVVSVSSNDRPEIVDANLNVMTEKINSGDYGRVSLSCKWFDTGSNKGVTYYLNNVMFLERGERIDGRTSAAEDFAEF